VSRPEFSVAILTMILMSSTAHAGPITTQTFTFETAATGGTDSDPSPGGQGFIQYPPAIGVPLPIPNGSIDFKAFYVKTPMEGWFPDRFLVHGGFRNVTGGIVTKATFDCLGFHSIDMENAAFEAYFNGQGSFSLSASNYDEAIRGTQSLVGWGTEMSTGNPLGGMSAIDNLTLTIEPLGDILRNSVRVDWARGNPTINAYFEPKLADGTPLPLSIVAQAAGVDHFNWVQSMSGPGNWVWSVNGDFANPIPSPVIDPLQTTDWNDSYVVMVKAFDVLHPQDIFGIHNPYPIDTAPYYWEDAIEYRQYQPDENTAWFQDTPRVPDWALTGDKGSGVAHPDFYFSFRTELVGVTANGDLVDLESAFGTSGLAFSWKSNAVFNSLGSNMSGDISHVGYLRNPGDIGPAISSGGVFDVQFDRQAPSIPEPSTLVLLSMLFGTIGAARSYQRLKRTAAAA